MSAGRPGLYWKSCCHCDKGQISVWQRRFTSDSAMQAERLETLQEEYHFWYNSLLPVYFLSKQNPES